MTTIPANTLVNVAPSVLGAGGDGVDVRGLLLTTSSRVPVGTVATFTSPEAVADYFGSGSTEAIFAGGATNRGTGYFGGYRGATKAPASLLVAQYHQNAVAAYLRGGDVSAMTLAQIQALSGALNVVVDGYARNAGSVNLSAASSFSSAASIIQTALNAAAPTQATLTGEFGAAITGAISGTTLTVSAVASGLISVGDEVTGAGVTAGTLITALGTGTGGTGTYTVSESQTVGSGSLTINSKILNVSAVASGTIAVGQTVDSSGSDAIITSLGTGAGATGTYITSGANQRVASESMTTKATAVTVTYDSTSGGFLITSGITGAPESTAAFATGSLSSSLKLTSATGAVTSQGADAAVPATFMDGIVGINPNWVMFTTAFDPDSSGNTVKQAFAAWNTSKNNRFCYVCWDTDTTPQTTLPATASLGYILANNDNSGTCLLEGEAAAGWDADAGISLAAFVMGTAAAIDFSRRNGRVSFAYRSQDGLLATLTDATVAANLYGQPLVANSYGNGYNAYGAFGTANPGFTWFQRGLVTGDYRWLDTYINQVWMSNAFQVALLTLLEGARSIPYSTAGYAMIEAALGDAIQAALNFGAFGPATLSQSQIAAVNAAAGIDISATLQATGYFLQVKPASAAVRNARTSPECTFWYIDQGSVQAINLASVTLL